MPEDYCINCGMSFIGNPIPQKDLDEDLYVDGDTHYRLEVGYEITGIYDGVLFWACPSCGWAWPRVFGEPGLDEKSKYWVHKHNKNVRHQ